MERKTRKQYDACHRHEREAEERDRSLAMIAEDPGSDRVPLALVRDDEECSAVDEDSRPTEQGEDDEPDPVEGRVDVEVAAEPAADAGDHSVRPAPAQLFVCRLFCHSASLPAAAPGVDPENPWFDPTIALRWPRS